MILIVDDQPIFRALFSSALEFAGRTSRTAEYGSEAISIIGDERPNLVIVDYTLVDMPVGDFLRWLRDAHREDPIPVLVAISIMSDACFATLRQFGLGRYIFKPDYDPATLRDIVDQTLGDPVLEGHIREITQRGVMVEPVIERLRRQDADRRALRS